MSVGISDAERRCRESRVGIGRGGFIPDFIIGDWRASSLAIECDAGPLNLDLIVKHGACESGSYHLQRRRTSVDCEIC